MASDTSPKRGINQAYKGFGGKVNPSVGKATQWKPGVSGNPAGPGKGFKHINTVVQELMNDPDFTAWIADPRTGFKEFKGAPIKAIVQAQMNKAIAGDTKAYDSLIKSGWSQKIETDITSGGDKLEVGFSAEQAEQLIRARASRSDI